jgi:heme/copper-type cytochrome/quinol oxidase subunit 4
MNKGTSGITIYVHLIYFMNKGMHKFEHNNMNFFLLIFGLEIFLKSIIGNSLYWSIRVAIVISKLVEKM